MDQSGLARHDLLPLNISRPRGTGKKPLTPDDLSPLCDKPQLADVDLHDGSLCDDPQAGVQWRRWVLLHPQDGQAERGLQLRMSDMGFLKS